jgi:hypothetical protein
VDYSWLIVTTVTKSLSYLVGYNQAYHVTHASTVQPLFLFRLTSSMPFRGGTKGLTANEAKERVMPKWTIMAHLLKIRKRKATNPKTTNSKFWNCTSVAPNWPQNGPNFLNFRPGGIALESAIIPHLLLAWLVSKETPFLWGSKLSYTQIYSFLPHSPVVVSLQTAHKKL